MSKNTRKFYLHLVRKNLFTCVYIYGSYNGDHRNRGNEEVQFHLFTNGQYYVKFS